MPASVASRISQLRKISLQFLPVLLVISTAVMLWESLAVITNSPSPIVVVISESMEPAFQRGDILFLWNRDAHVQVGEIAVCWFQGRDLPMVHRVVKSIPSPQLTESGESNGASSPMSYKILTKGDNNDVDDTELYPPGQGYVDRSEIVGSVRGYIPYVGYITVILNECPWLKAAVLGISALVFFLQRE